MWNSREGNERMRIKERIKPFLKYIEEMWLEYPDYRFGQLLDNIGISANWHIEDTNQNIPHYYMREIQHWGTYNRDYIKNTLIQVPISKLVTDHIENILRTQNHISNNLKNIFKNELRYREILEIEMQLNIEEQGFR